MSDDAQPAGVRDVLSLSVKLAQRVLHARDSGQALSMNELEAVVKAAEFLHARNLPWPAVVTEVVDNLVTQMEGIRAASGNAEIRLPADLKPSAASSRKP